MEHRIRSVYSAHNGSGRFMTSYPERSEDGSAGYVFSLSQVPQSLEEYDDKGKTKETVNRGLI